MIEYVITAGPGIMLEHGVEKSGKLFALGLVLAGTRDGSVVTLAIAPPDTTPTRFH